MTRTRFGRVATLRTDRTAKSSNFRIGLESVEKSTGRLSFDPDVEYNGEGITFREGDVLFGKLRPNLAKACSRTAVVKPAATFTSTGLWRIASTVATFDT